jgi:hypothetical protein
VQERSGQRAQALDTVVEGLAVDPRDAVLRKTLDSLLRNAQSGAQRSKQDALDVDADAGADETFGRGVQKEREAVSLRRAGRSDAATRSFWAAADHFKAAASESRRIAGDEEAERARLAEQARIKKNENPSVAEQTPRPNANDGANRKPPDTALEQEGVIQTLRRYEAAYGRLSADAVKSVYPSAPIDQLATFADYRSYSLRVQVVDFKFYFFSETRTSAVVTGRVIRDVLLKSGQRTQSERSEMFTLERQGQAQTWIIVNIR